MKIKEVLQRVTGAKSEEAAVEAIGLHVCIVLYSTAYWMCSPLLPFLTKELGADRVVFGYMQSFFEAMQIISSVFFGRIIDTVGPRAAMALAQGGTGLSYIILAFATDVPILFISRIPTIFMACMLCAQGAMPALCAPEKRAVALGRLSVSYLLGMLIGSPTGGFLSKAFGHSFVGIVSGLLSFAMAGAAFLFMSAPKQAQAVAEGQSKPEAKKSGGLDLMAVFRMSMRDTVRPLVMLMTVAGLSMSIHRSTFSIILPDHFGLAVDQVGLIMSFGALIGVVSNVGVIPLLTARYSENLLLLASVIGLTASMLVYTLCTTYMHLLVVLVPSTVCSTLLYTLSASAMSNSVQENETGTAVSISHSLRSLMGLLSPPIGGFIFRDYGYEAVGYVSAALAALAAVFVFHQGDRIKVQRVKSDVQQQQKKVE